MKVELDSFELATIQRAMANIDPFSSVKDAKSRVYTTKQRIESLHNQLEVDEQMLSDLLQRESLILKLKNKLEERK